MHQIATYTFYFIAKSIKQYEENEVTRLEFENLIVALFVDGKQVK